MKRTAWTMRAGVVAAGLGMIVVAAALAGDGEKPGGLPPLKVDTDTPLMLDEPGSGKAKKKPSADAADNSACLCCHTNYEEETLALVHAEAKMGCVECHGKSYAHRDDEDNITPPDVMYWPEKIDPACKDCHDSHDAPAKKVIATWQKRCPSKENPDDLVCTDCHGEHRLKFRTVWWNKKTRKLIVREEGQRIKLRDGAGDDSGAPEMTAPADEDAMQ